MDLLAAARAVFADLGEPHEVTDTDIALAEAHLMAGRPEAALEAVASAVEAARAIGAVTLLPSAYRVSAAALLELGDLPAARRSLDEGLRLGSSPDLAHERGFLLVVAARAAELAGSADAADAGRGGPGRADLARRGPRAPALARARATGRSQTGRLTGSWRGCRSRRAPRCRGRRRRRACSAPCPGTPSGPRRARPSTGQAVPPANAPVSVTSMRTSNFGTPPFEQSVLSHPMTNVAGAAFV